MTVFSGHTENAGHFLQPATMAIGHMVIALLLLSLFEHRAEHDVAHEHYCERVGAEVQTNSDYLGTAKEASASLVERAVPRAVSKSVHFWDSPRPRLNRPRCIGPLRAKAWQKLRRSFTPVQVSSTPFRRSVDVTSHSWRRCRWS